VDRSTSQLTPTEPRTRYAIVVRLPREVEVRIEDTFLAVIGATKPAMGYHLTILGPYCLARGVTSPFLAAISRVCRQAEPFTVRLAGLGVFRTTDNNAVYLKVADPAAVFALHERLLRATAGVALPENERLRAWTVDNYNPHVTLGLGMSDDDLEEFLRHGEGRAIEAEFAVRQVWLVEQVLNGPWEVAAEYPLGVAPPPSPQT